MLSIGCVSIQVLTDRFNSSSYSDDMADEAKPFMGCCCKSSWNNFSESLSNAIPRMFMEVASGISKSFLDSTINPPDDWSSFGNIVKDDRSNWSVTSSPKGSVWVIWRNDISSKSSSYDVTQILISSSSSFILESASRQVEVKSHWQLNGIDVSILYE